MRWEIRLKIFDPIISNSFPVRYYGISGTNLPDIPCYTPESRLTYGIPNIFKYDLLREPPGGVCLFKSPYGVAKISRPLQNIGLLTEYRSLLWGSVVKETYTFKEPTN